MINISGQSPAEGARNVFLNSLVEFSLISGDTDLDLSSLIVFVSGHEVIRDLSFNQGYDGPFSSIELTSFGASIVIDKESLFLEGEVILVKIQVKDLNNKYFNHEYVFRAIPSEPILDVSSPEDGALVKSDQTIFLEFKDEIDGVDPDSINIWINGLSAVVGGSFENIFNGTNSIISNTEFGVSVRIDPSEPLRDGPYTVKYSASDANSNILYGEYSFSVDLPEIVLPSVFPQIKFLGFSKGAKKVSNLGRGDMMQVEWHTPVSRSYRGDSFALIYENESRLDIFDSSPKYIATKDTQVANLSGFTPGKRMSFAVRAMEAFSGTLSLDGMPEVSENVFTIPGSAEISEQILETDFIFNVISTEGYPSSGILIVNNSEVIRYSSKTATSFMIPSGGRGLNGTSPGIYMDGDLIEMFFACQDQNSVIVVGTPTYIDGYESGREINGTGLVVTDYTDNDRKFFQGFDFCGYHRAMPQKILQGVGDCGSYLGGEFNGMRGMNLFDRMLNREEVLLDQVGEPVILLKRIWDGEKCSCSDSRRLHPKIKSCKKCFGTGYLNGYVQYDYRRRNDGRVMMAFGDTKEDLKLGQQSHLEQDYEPQCWTLPNPAIRDRDLIVRFDFNNDVEYIYEVLNTTKDKLFFRHYTRQRLNIKRMDKTDVIYTIPYSFGS